MHPRHHARARPDHPAIIMAGSGQVVTYKALEDAADRGAQLFRSLGLAAGDTIACFLDNRPEYLFAYWAAQRSGLYITPISSRLTAAEAAYIIGDCGAQALITSTGVEAARALVEGRAALIPAIKAVFYAGEPIAGAESFADALATQPAEPIADETAGFYMVYSSGTTGRPKGIRLPLTGGPPDAPMVMTERSRRRYGFDERSIYLSPAPIYHAAPLAGSTGQHRTGGTSVVMERFDAEAFLAAVERYKVTHAQVVPTMFVRLLKLPAAVREKYDLSSLRCIAHAAAPCPVPVKRQMIEWLGPIIYEYYSGSEANGSTFITPQEWLQKPGSVGKADWGELHIVGEDGEPLGPGETGAVYFSGGLDFKYHNDPEKTASARHPKHPDWSTLGDIGHMDEDGYLFLTDRKAFMIISGGVNIYPQEAENLLITHPKVADAAVFGVPDEEMGEAVKAVVQPLDWSQAGPELEAELIAFCKASIAHYKCPRSIDFDRELPRAPTGKLYKQPLKARYWPQPA